jgi:predicted flap endonuclease-1-like 5' DNA nuclease
MSVLKLCLTAEGSRREIVELAPEASLESLYDKASLVFDAECVQLKSGFPPQSLERSSSQPVQSVLHNNDRVTVVLAPPQETKKKRSLPSTAKPTEQITSRPKRAAAKAATDSFAQVIKAQDQLLKEQSATKRRRTPQSASPASTNHRSNHAAARRLAQLPGRRLGDGVSVGPSRKSSNGPKCQSKDDISFALLNALQSDTTTTKVDQVLRHAMRNAVTRQYDASRAVTRVSAVQAGKYSLVLQGEDQLVVTYDKGLEGRGTVEETVDCIGREALQAVLKGIHASDRESLRALAQLSPRCFWSILYHTQARSIDEALQELLPELDWSFLKRRKQTLSEKAKENLRQEQEAKGQVMDLDRAHEAVAAVEHAMEHLQAHDIAQRRQRAARAALTRQEWTLVTPTEEDMEELQHCTGGDEDMAQKLKDLGIHNWRELANVEEKDVANPLNLEEETVEVWLDRARIESVEEIMVEICNNQVEVVEALRDEARTGTPKVLANWRNMPDMLFQATPSLASLGVTVNDLEEWCYRAFDLLAKYVWLNEYATPVE